MSAAERLMILLECCRQFARLPDEKGRYLIRRRLPDTHYYLEFMRMRDPSPSLGSEVHIHS
jgi:hypothetical protein